MFRDTEEPSKKLKIEQHQEFNIHNVTFDNYQSFEENRLNLNTYFKEVNKKILANNFDDTQNLVDLFFQLCLLKDEIIKIINHDNSQKNIPLNAIDLLNKTSQKIYNLLAESINKRNIDLVKMSYENHKHEIEIEIEKFRNVIEKIPDLESYISSQTTFYHLNFDERVSRSESETDLNSTDDDTQEPIFFLSKQEEPTKISGTHIGMEFYEEIKHKHKEILDIKIKTFGFFTDHRDFVPYPEEVFNNLQQAMLLYVIYNSGIPTPKCFQEIAQYEKEFRECYELRDALKHRFMYGYLEDITLYLQLFDQILKNFVDDEHEDFEYNKGIQKQKLNELERLRRHIDVCKEKFNFYKDTLNLDLQELNILIEIEDKIIHHCERLDSLTQEVDEASLQSHRPK